VGLVPSQSSAPSALPPNGPAGGGLGGTFPNPYVIDGYATALGAQFETWPPAICTTAAAGSTGSIYGAGIFVPSGVTLTGVKVRVYQAAAGTNPTLVRLGIASTAFTMLAVSANLNTTAYQATGVFAAPFGSSYTTTTAGGIYAMLLQVGTWGTTQPNLLELSVTGSEAALVADGTNMWPVFTVSGAQTDLPLVGNTFTPIATTRSYYFALY
jgi:hypothetical protein